MAPTTRYPAMYKLPDELLLHIASHLGARESRESRGELGHLRNLCLVSKRLYPIAQEHLYVRAFLPVACGCHPGVNAAVQLLRTLLDRPELAAKVKALRFTVTRRSVAKLYGQKGFDFGDLLQKSRMQLSKIGYCEGEPWLVSLNNNVESAYAGLLLVLLHNLDHLDCTIKDHYRGWPTTEPISALFGTSTVPDGMAAALRNIQSLVIPDPVYLKAMHFTGLKVLDLKHTDIGTLLRLNGPASIAGTSQLEELALGTSVQFMDSDQMSYLDMDADLSNLFAALGCKTLTCLRLMLYNDACPIGGAPSLRVKHLMKQFSSSWSTLRVLEIDLELDDDTEGWEWFFSNCGDLLESYDIFPAMERLKIPQRFLFVQHPTTHGILPKDLPRKLQRLDIVAPNEDVFSWVAGFYDVLSELPDFRSIFLHCREGLQQPAVKFNKAVNNIWLELFEDFAIESFVCDQADGTLKSVVPLHALDPGEDNGNEESEYEENVMDTGDEHMPDVEHPRRSEEDHDFSLLVDEVE